MRTPARVLVVKAVDSYNPVMRWQTMTTCPVSLLVMTLAMRAIWLAHAGCALAVGQVSPEKDLAPPDLAAIKAEVDKLRSEQYAIGERLLQEFPQEFEALRIMGFVYSGRGDREKMVECWRKCAELEPNRPDVQDQLGRYYFENQAYEKAIEHWQRALAINAKFPGAHRQIGEALLQSGKPEEAKTQLQSAVEIAPKDSEVHFVLGEVHFQLRDFKAAKQSYLRAVELKPTHKQAYYGLVKTCSQLGEREELAKYSQKFKELNSAMFAADREYRRQFDELEKIREEVAVTCADAGRLYAINERLTEAEPLWKRASKLDEDNPTSRKLLAALYLKQRKAREALEQFNSLARLEPANPDHYQQLGFLQARLGNLEAAERDFKQMVRIAPKNAAGYRSLAKFYLNTKREAKRAAQLAATAVKLEPVADSYFVLGWAQAVNGRRDEADVALKKAVELDPKNPTYRQLHEMVRSEQSK
jgi:tetratricopeptide (TPR) repeat protein